MTDASPSDPDRGRGARRPRDIPAKGWKDIALRVWRSIDEDRVMLVAAGVTFYLLLALFPTLAAFVSLYGLFADPAVIADQVESLRGVLPAEGIELVTAQLRTLAGGQSASLTVGFAISFLIAFWSANSGMKALIEAMNIAHDEREKRSFLKLTLLSFALTLGAMTLSILMITAVAVVPAVLAIFDLGSVASVLVWLVRWPLLLLVVAGAMAALYRWAPSRKAPEWRWVTWGSGIATVVWLVASIAFTIYLENFANYSATYGSLGALVGLLLWIWIAVMILIIGAEINSEMEHQTARDSTVGPNRPMGQRGAVMADTLGERSD
ncbi:YihY/virulence factor BrkB family protein [Cereibacter azotoformans]|uniref:Membrane protein n=1 Tax=Cereibacter azotoformans TaxID=43057 RepID=A0A2T5K932_9RHOB|nr:YihY/virulence factor BrkB family protein [Cereibacter azotoformans]AXQ93342.1 YihY/virulence factor BrkB family protein [Cereibacter sphaeroides]MBO4168992.1 YihY/virulence factor BrkB family protein [Cereibacter azotoformans]PTR18924.1 membrane protein [Cereibacter azotoformans]UIJ31659.1 YihY/virulence factor BrkB family protein [Cereibacter azotoformans]